MGLFDSLLNTAKKKLTPVVQDVQHVAQVATHNPVTNFAGGIVKAPAQMLNTAAADIPTLDYTIRQNVAAHTNNQVAYKNATANLNNAMNQYKSGGGLFNAGTFYSKQDANKGQLTTGLRKIGGGTAQTAATVAFPGESKAVTGVVSKILPKAAQTAAKGLVPKVAAGAIVGAGNGAVSNTAGYVQGDQKLQASGLTHAAALGAGLGAVTGGAIPLAAPVARAAGNAAKKAAPEIINGVKTAAQDITKTVASPKVLNVKPHAKLSDNEVSAAAKYQSVRAGQADPMSITSKDSINYKNFINKSGLSQNDANGITKVVKDRADYELTKIRRQGAVSEAVKSVKAQLPSDQKGFVKIPGSSNGKLPIKPPTARQKAPVIKEVPGIPQKTVVSSENSVPTSTSSAKVELPAQVDTSEVPVKQQLPLLPGQRDVTSPNNTPVMSIPKDAPTSGPRMRGLSQTILDDPNTPAASKAGVAELYNVRNTKDLQSRAANLVKDDPELAARVFANQSNSDVGTMVGSELSAHLSRTGNHEAAVETSLRLAREATNRGQANQALSTWGKLAPESILRFAQKTVEEYNRKAGVSGAAGELKLTPQQGKDIFAASEKLQAMPEGRAKDIATQQMLKQVKELVPASWVKKVGTLQTIGQLLNPKTLIRNVVGNGLFNPLEAASQTVAAGLDKGITGIQRLAGNKSAVREVALPQLGAQVKGAMRGAKEQAQELHSGVNLGPDTQFDLNQTSTFKNKALKGLETTMGYALRVPDRAAFTAAYDDTIQGLMKANKLTEPTQQILDQAEVNGLYRTFQDNSKAAQLFTKLKSAFNAIGVEGKDGARFGLGDLILKYPKTPGNLIGRGLDYSPAGVVGGILKAASNGIAGRPFDKAALVNSIGRGTVGTGALIGSGAALGALGIITEKPSDDADTRNLQKESGQGGYQINTSALTRFVKSGFNKEAAKLQPNDTLVSYDWAQPASIPLSTGAALGKKQSPKDAATSTLSSVSDGLNTLVEQPLVTGVNQFASDIKNKGLVGALGETVKGLPASFVPTASNQIRQLTDNTTRNTYSDNVGQQVVQSVENKIPVLAKRVLPSVGPLGEDKQNYQNGSNNIGNVLFNPAFISKYQPKEAAKLPLNIMDKSGETKQNPLTPKTTQTVNGVKQKLTPLQNNQLSKFIGTKTDDAYKALSKDKDFQSLPPQEQAKKMSSILSDISAAGKIQVLGDNPKSPSINTKAILQGNTPNYTDPTISTRIGKDSKDILTKYNALNADQKKQKAYGENDYDYKVAAAKYENNVSNQSLSTSQKIQAQDNLRKAKIGSNYSKDTRELYSLSKSDLYDYLTTSSDGNAQYDKLKAYDQALYDAGLSSTKKFKNGLSTKTKNADGSKRTKSIAAFKPQAISTPKSGKISSRKVRLASVKFKKNKIQSPKKVKALA